MVIRFARGACKEPRETINRGFPPEGQGQGDRVRDSQLAGHSKQIHIAGMNKRAEQVEIDLFRAMPVARKLEVAHALREMAWALKTSVVEREHPGWTEPEVRAEVLRLFTHVES